MLELIADVCEAAVCSDGLDISNCMSFERLERRRQMIEEGYRQRLEEQKMSKALSKDPSQITASAFAGKTKMAGGALVCPELITYVSKKAMEDSELVRQQRKALEARSSAGANRKGNK